MRVGEKTRTRGMRKGKYRKDKRETLHLPAFSLLPHKRDEKRCYEKERDKKEIYDKERKRSPTAL